MSTRHFPHLFPPLRSATYKIVLIDFVHSYFAFKSPQQPKYSVHFAKHGSSSFIMDAPATELFSETFVSNSLKRRATFKSPNNKLKAMAAQPTSSMSATRRVDEFLDIMSKSASSPPIQLYFEPPQSNQLTTSRASSARTRAPNFSPAPQTKTARHRSSSIGSGR